jgi:hypothetical protein
MQLENTDGREVKCIACLIKQNFIRYPECKKCKPTEIGSMQCVTCEKNRAKELENLCISGRMFCRQKHSLTYRPDFLRFSAKCAGCSKTFAELWCPVFECKQCQIFLNLSYFPVDERSYEEIIS